MSVIKVGVIGLGLMGLSIAKNLAKAGFETTVYDVLPTAAVGIDGLHSASDVAGVGQACSVVFLSLPGPVEVEQVCLGQGGLISTMAPGTVIFDLSTNSLATVKKIQSAMRQAGIDFLDAPVSGGPWGAADGTLAIWIGGDQAAFEHGSGPLAAIGKRISYMGSIGTGTVTKLVHNTAANIRTSMLGEVLSLGVKSGIEPTALWAAVRNGSNGRSRTFDALGGKILDGSYETPAFKLRHARKDLAVAIQLGEEFHVPLELTKVVMSRIDEAISRGWEDMDSNIQVKIQQEKAGLDIKPIDKAILGEILARD